MNSGTWFYTVGSLQESEVHRSGSLARDKVEGGVELESRRLDGRSNNPSSGLVFRRVAEAFLDEGTMIQAVAAAAVHHDQDHEYFIS